MVSLEQSPTIVGQAGEIGVDQRAGGKLEPSRGWGIDEVCDRHDQWRISSDSRLAVVRYGELGERPRVVLSPALGKRLVEPPELTCAGLRAQQFPNVRDARPRIPHIERPHGGEPAHRLSVLARQLADDRDPPTGAEAVFTTGDGHACREPLQIPFPRAGKRLVEVDEVEQQLPLGRCEPTEVRQVGVAAQLHPNPRLRRDRQVGGHHVRGAPVEAEGRERHAPVADGNQFRHALGGLLFEQRDRVLPVGRRRPAAVA